MCRVSNGYEKKNAETGLKRISSSCVSGLWYSTWAGCGRPKPVSIATRALAIELGKRIENDGRLFFCHKHLQREAQFLFTLRGRMTDGRPGLDTTKLAR